MRGCRLRTEADQGPWLERSIEDAAAASVEREHAHVLLHAFERRRDHVWRAAGSGGLSRDILHEVAAAAGGVGGDDEGDMPESAQKATGLPVASRGGDPSSDKGNYA
jgi:hypothetical protein